MVRLLRSLVGGKDVVQECVNVDPRTSSWGSQHSTSISFCFKSREIESFDNAARAVVMIVVLEDSVCAPFSAIQSFAHGVRASRTPRPCRRWSLTTRCT